MACVFSPRAALARADVEVGVDDRPAYASLGVVEVGGSGAFAFTSKSTHVSARTFVGWFFANHLQVSGIAELAWSQVRVPGPADGMVNRSSTLFGIYAEPSLHVPVSSGSFALLGLGFGPTYDSEQYGLAVRPRVGFDLQLGGTAIFRPAFEITYSTVDVVSRSNQSVEGANLMYGISIGVSAWL